MPYIGKQLSNGNYLKLDDISSQFNGSKVTFSLTNGGSAYYPGSELSILVSVGGVIQEPESAYQISNDEITFANAPTAQDSFFCVVLGDAIGINVPGNNTVNGAQMAKPFNYDGGLLYLDDTNNKIGINNTSPTVALDITGDLKVSGNITGIGGTLGGTLVGNVYASSGISTFNDLRVTNNLTVEGTTTTLDTNLIGVDRVEVGANSNSVVGVAITQSGTADILQLFDGTSKVVTIDDEGNIGVGEDSPSYILDVKGDSGITQSSSSNSTAGQISIVGRNSGGSASAISRLKSYPDGSSNQSHFAIETRNSSNNMVERLRITSVGKVGIGTNNPNQPVSITNGRVNIDVKNDYYGVWADGDTTGENHISVGRWHNTGGSLKSGYTAYGINNLILENNHPTAAHTLIIQPKGQKVAIGTHISDGLVHIGQTSAGTVSADADADELVLESSGNTGMSILSPGTGESSIYFGNPGTNGQKDGWIKYYHETHSTTANRRNLVFTTATNERLRITSTGFVGLSTANPLAPLHAFNATNNTIAILESGDATSRLRLKDNTGEAYVAATGDDLIFANTSSVTERLRITSAGTVNIGGSFTQTTYRARILTASNKTISFGNAAHNDLSNEGSGIFFSRQNDGSAELSGLFAHSNGGFGIATREYLTFHTGGGSTYGAAVERLRIASDGHVAIGGYGDPNSILDVREDKDGAETMIRLWNTDNGDTTTQTAAFYMSPDSRGNATTGLRAIKENASFATNAGRDIALSLNVTKNNSQVQALRITSDGNLRQAWSDGTFMGQYYDSTYYMGFTYGATARTLYIDNRSNDTRADIVFRTGESAAAAERLRIDSNGRVSINDNTRPASDANEGAQLRVTGSPLTRTQYYSPAGQYFGSFGYTDDSITKSWISVDSAYNKTSAVSSGIFLSAFHSDANGSACGHTIKNTRADAGGLVFSTVHAASSTGNAATEAVALRIDSSGRIRTDNGTQVSDFDITRSNSTITDVMLVKGNAGNGFIRFQDNDSTCNWTMGVDDGSGIGANGFIWYDRINAAYRLSIDNDGDVRVWNGSLGVGIDPTEKLHVQKNYNGHTRAVIQNNWGANATAQLKLISPTDEFQLIKYSSGDAAINLSNSADIYFSIAGSERFRIHSDGTLELNNNTGKMIDLRTSSGTGSNYIQLSDSAGNQKGYFGYGSSSSEQLYIVQQESADITIYNGSASRWYFKTTGAFNSATDGQINVYGGSGNATNDARIYVDKSSNADWCIAANAATFDYGIYTRIGNGASYGIGVYDHTNSSWRFRVNGSGTIYAVSTTISSISDVRLKENIVDANSQWDDIKALRFRNFKWKADSGYADGKTYLGLISQEVEPISPNLVEINAQTKEDIENEVPDPEYKNVKYSIVWMKAVKALQEAQARIETLEAKVAALEGS